MACILSHSLEAKRDRWRSHSVCKSRQQQARAPARQGQRGRCGWPPSLSVCAWPAARRDDPPHRHHAQGSISKWYATREKLAAMGNPDPMLSKNFLRENNDATQPLDAIGAAEATARRARIAQDRRRVVLVGADTPQSCWAMAVRCRERVKAAYVSF